MIFAFVRYRENVCLSKGTISILETLKVPEVILLLLEYREFLKVVGVFFTPFGNRIFFYSRYVLGVLNVLIFTGPI